MQPGAAQPTRRYPLARRDDLRPLFILILVLGVVGAIILALGALEFAIFEPLGQQTGTQVRISGVFNYDPSSGLTSGSDTDHFNRDQAFAAVVDWSSIPPDLEVGARWYNSFGERVGGVGPAQARDLTNHRVVAAGVAAGMDKNLPGHYLFIVERYSADGQPVEVIGRRGILVERGP